MKKQDKLFSLLKQNGWERVNTPEGVGYRFKALNPDSKTAHYDAVEALGWCEALEINNRKILTQKEDEYYITYLEF